MHFMTTDPNLQFLREKIYQIRTAIMYSLSNEVIKLPNNIVKAMKVDNEGQLWFVCRHPGRQVEQYEKTFPARLHFYRKGIFFHIAVSGKATIIDNADDYITTSRGSEKPILIRMTMNNIEYAEPHEKKKSRAEILLEQGYKWMLHRLTIPHDTRSILSKLQSMNRA
jgi:hypothetical protein